MGGERKELKKTKQGCGLKIETCLRQGPEKRKKNKIIKGISFTLCSLRRNYSMLHTRNNSK
jgi:hypothetical protein